MCVLYLTHASVLSTTVVFGLRWPLPGNLLTVSCDFVDLGSLKKFLKSQKQFLLFVFIHRIRSEWELRAPETCWGLRRAALWMFTTVILTCFQIVVLLLPQSEGCTVCFYDFIITCHCMSFTQEWTFNLWQICRDKYWNTENLLMCEAFQCFWQADSLRVVLMAVGT